MQTKRKINMVVKNITHTSTQSTHTYTYRGVHLRDTQKYAIKKELTHANCQSSHKCRKWAFAGRVKSVAHIFIAYIFVYSEFFFSFLHLLHKLPMKLQNICRLDGTQLGSFVAVITLWPNRCAERCEAGEITIINQFAKKTHIFRKQFKCHFMLAKQLNCISMQTS